MMKSLPMWFAEPILDVNILKGARAYLYCRVPHNDGFSLEAQKKELMKYAEQIGVVVEGIMAEYAGGLTLNRSGMKEVNKHVCSGDVDMVLTTDSSRISRDTEQFQEYINFLSRHGVFLYSMKEQQLFRGRHFGCNQVDSEI